MGTEQDVLPDLSQALASLGRGSLVAKIERLEALVDNIHSLVINGMLDSREKCQHIRMAIYKETGK